MRRRLHYCAGLGAGEAGFFFRECRFDFLSGKNKGDENRLAASPVFAGRFIARRSISWRSGRKASESVAAVDQFFDVEEQELILRH